MKNIKNFILHKPSFGRGMFLLSFFVLIGMGTSKAAETLPDFTIETLEGKFTLSEHLGKTVVLFFSFPG